MKFQPTPALPTDEELWQLACKGQEMAFTQIMQRYANRLVGYGRKWTRDEDLIKNTNLEKYNTLYNLWT